MSDAARLIIDLRMDFDDLLRMVSVREILPVDASRRMALSLLRFRAFMFW